jgi:hypothetical protein
MGSTVFRPDHIAGPKAVGHPARRRALHYEIAEGRTARERGDTTGTGTGAGGIKEFVQDCMSGMQR